MKIAFVLSTLIALGPISAQAADVMTPEEFEAYTTGKTLLYSQKGETYGMEQYLSNRHVIWSFADGQCVKGNWFPDHGKICFVYNFDAELQCWDFMETEDGLSAIFEGGEPEEALTQLGKTTKPIACVGPDVGV